MSIHKQDEDCRYEDAHEDVHEEVYGGVYEDAIREREERVKRGVHPLLLVVLYYT